MKRFFTMTLGALAFTVTAAQADERYNHFPALDSPDLKTALCHLAKYNQELESITNQPELSAQSMVKVHELTYTLEKAVQRLQTDLSAIAELLEKVHKASEHMDHKTVNSAGGKYLKATGLITSEVKC